MSRRTAAWVAWSVSALSLSIMAVGLLLIFLGWSTPLPPGRYPWTYMAIDIGLRRVWRMVLASVASL
jgi:hypothetical protein